MPMSVPSAWVTTVPALAGGRLPFTLVDRLTGNQIDALGRRIRDAPDPAQLDQGDLTLLQRLLAEHAEVLEQVNRQLHRIGLNPHPRLKSTDTIVEKLRREPLSLRGIHDLAGTRVVRRMTLDMQDTLVPRICAVCPGAGEPIDRRARPNHGYRAVHVVCRVGGRHVEIQVRTLYQDTWAQVMERLGDVLNRQIRYGEPPTDPDAPAGERIDASRQELLVAIMDTSRVIAQLEAEETATGTLDDEHEVRRSLIEMREILGLPEVP